MRGLSTEQRNDLAAIFGAWVSFDEEERLYTFGITAYQYMLTFGPNGSGILGSNARWLGANEYLFDDIINDHRWDMTYLGMQVMIEGLALAAFGNMMNQTATTAGTSGTTMFHRCSRPTAPSRTSSKPINSSSTPGTAGHLCASISSPLGVVK